MNFNVKTWIYVGILWQFLVQLKEHPSSHQPCSFLIQFCHSILKKNSVNKISNDRQCCITSYYKEKSMILYENSEILSNKSGTAASCGLTVMMFHTKFRLNWIINEDFKILGKWGDGPFCKFCINF